MLGALCPRLSGHCIKAKLALPDNYSSVTNPVLIFIRTNDCQGGMLMFGLWNVAGRDAGVEPTGTYLRRFQKPNINMPQPKTAKADIFDHRATQTRDNKK
jgi:hypothetical protein